MEPINGIDLAKMFTGVSTEVGKATENAVKNAIRSIAYEQTNLRLKRHALTTQLEATTARLKELDERTARIAAGEWEALPSIDEIKDKGDKSKDDKAN